MHIFNRYVIEDGSPYRRSAKQNASSQGAKAGRGRPVLEVDDDDNGWSFGSFIRKDAVKDSIPDQQLSQQELSLRYPSEGTKIFSGIPLFLCHFRLFMFLCTMTTVNICINYVHFILIWS